MAHYVVRYTQPEPCSRRILTSGSLGLRPCPVVWPRAPSDGTRSPSGVLCNSRDPRDPRASAFGIGMAQASTLPGDSPSGVLRQLTLPRTSPSLRQVYSDARKSIIFSS